MSNRIDLQAQLEEIMESELALGYYQKNEAVEVTGVLDIVKSSNVYFQPPENVKLSYPCIVYSRKDVGTRFANDKPYNHQVVYSITVIDKDPDSEIPWKIAALPMSSFDRHYKSDNLNHDVYNLYY